MTELGYKAHLSLMARYNAVMNAKLVALLTPVPTEQLAQSRGAFFGSVLGTLNHLMVADLLWLNRMRPYPYGAVLAPLDALPHPTELSEILFEDMAGFAVARTQLDSLISAFVDGLSEADIASPLAYRSTMGLPFTKTLGPVLSHVFNHQTHHRGQITTLLSQMGLDIGVTDLAPLVPDVV